MSHQIAYPEPIEAAITSVESLLSFEPSYSLSRRSIALIILQQDASVWESLGLKKSQYPEIEGIINGVQQDLGEPVAIAIASYRQQLAWQLEKKF